jgi:predicted O-methyltransferase YrrM
MQLSMAEIPNVEYVSGRHALRNYEPWIVPEAVEYLEKLVKPDWKVFEWGCGGSAIWFAQRCTKVVVVENVPRWVAWGVEQLQKIQSSNTTVTIVYAPTTQGDYTEYVNVIEAYPEASFDLISIDGVMSARKDSIENAKRKLKPDGIIMIDNSNKFEVEGLDGWSELRFQTVPFEYLGKTEVWTTSFYTKKLDT